MSDVYDALICGGGVIGLTATLAMAKRRQRVLVVDAGDLSQAQADHRVYAINQASQRLFEQLGVWSRIAAASLSPYRRMHVWDAASDACIDFDARSIARSELGWMIDEGSIRRALLQALDEEDDVERVSFHAITRVEGTADTVTVASAEQDWQTRLLLVADGGNSPARQQLKVPVTTWPYHQHALVASVRTQHAHQHTAWQVFHPDGPLAFLPLPDEHRCSIVWSTSPQRAQQLMTLDEAAFGQAVTTAFQQRLGDVTLESTRHQFPLIMRHARQYSGKNWLLMGDAAHTVHPLAGLGLNIGLADVAAWLSCLDDKRHTSRALAAYQRQRKHAVWQSIALLGGLKSLFASPLPPVVSLRGLGLNLCQRLTPVKRLFINHAAG